MGIPALVGFFGRALARPRRATASGAARHSRGQSLAEMAVALPVFVTLCFGVADGGRAFYYKEAVSNAARAALRAAVTSQAAGNTACASNGGQQVGHIPSVGGDTLNSTILNAAALESSSNGTAASSKIAAASTIVTVTWHCNGSSVYTNSSASSTDPASSGSAAVEVKVQYSFTPITPVIQAAWKDRAIVSDFVGRAEY